MKKLSAFLICIFILCSCTQQSAQLPSNKPSENTDKMDMMTYNKMCIEAEMAEIQEYLDSCKTDFTKSEQGYWYKIFKSNTDIIKGGDTISVIGSVEVLGSTPCIIWTETEPLNIRIGKRDHTKVLDLALENKAKGDEIWIISPSSLAYGIKGKNNCITPRTAVLYKIKVLKSNE